MILAPCWSVMPLGSEVCVDVLTVPLGGFAMETMLLSAMSATQCHAAGTVRHRDYV